MGSCVWRTQDGGVRAQVHSPPQGCDLETIRLPTLRARVALPGDCRVGRESTQMGHALERRSQRKGHQSCTGLQGSTESRLPGLRGMEGSLWGHPAGSDTASAGNGQWVHGVSVTSYNWV